MERVVAAREDELFAREIRKVVQMETMREVRRMSRMERRCSGLKKVFFIFGM